MGGYDRFHRSLGTAALLLVLASPAFAQIETSLSAYVGPNAEGYFRPLAEGLGTELNIGTFHSGLVPENGFHFSFEVRFMRVTFGEDDRTFAAVTEPGFSPAQTVQAPTVVGSKRAKIVTGDAGTKYAFPGGFDIPRLEFATPQVRIGAFHGTEALIRFFIAETGSAEFTDLNLYGFGFRHSVSQYLKQVPVDVSLSGMYQRFSFGRNPGGGSLISSDLLTWGLQMSKRFGVLEPYAGFSVDMYKTELTYDIELFDTTERVDVAYRDKNAYRMTLGLSLAYGLLGIHGEYNLAGQNSYSIGLAVGN